jgi:hypothetical protein
MNDPQETITPPKPANKKRAPQKKGPPIEGGSRGARKLAAAILEVLAGARLPSEAALALGIGVPRYYLLEARALQGLICACEPRPIGKVRTPESELASVRKELETMQRENARLSALVRAAQRTVGLSAPPPPKPAAKGKKAKKKRKPTVRALRAVARLKEGLDESPEPVLNAAPATDESVAVSS